MKMMEEVEEKEEEGEWVVEKEEGEAMDWW